MAFVWRSRNVVVFCAAENVRRQNDEQLPFLIHLVGLDQAVEHGGASNVLPPLFQRMSITNFSTSCSFNKLNTVP